MRKYVIYIGVFTLFFAFGAGAVEKSNIYIGSSDNTENAVRLQIKLTEAQAEKIANAGGEEVTIKLTEKQVEAVKAVIPKFKGEHEVKLNSGHIKPGNFIEVLWNDASGVAGGDT